VGGEVRNKKNENIFLNNKILSSSGWKRFYIFVAVRRNCVFLRFKTIFPKIEA